MEGEPEESDEDVKGEDKPTVLWEKSIQQSIFVDLSEDESLHLSDLESSLALHLSQAESAASEASIHLSGSAELSALEVTSSESSIVSSQSEKVVESKSSILHVSAQRPNTMQDEPPLKQQHDDPEQDTSDEDQDDLPYDGVLGSPYFDQAANSEGSMSSDGREIVHASPDVPALLECNTRDKDDIIERLGSVECNAEKPASLSQEDAHTKQDRFFDPSKPSEVAPLCPCPSDINQLLLRHFSQEELLWSGRLIEAETLPEVSLLESVDYTVFSCAPAHNSTKVNGNHSESYACNSQIVQSFCSDRTDEKCTTASTISSLEEEAEMKIDNATSTASDSFTSSSASVHSEQGSGNTSAVDVEKQENPEEDDQIQRVPLLRTRSFSEIKYGQGQVHYPLPDFSKIAPKVKIPKAPSGPVSSVPQSPTGMHRAQSSPGMLEVINRVLEDSVHTSEKPYVFKDEDKQSAPALVHHLQAEYDKLLTKYAEAENLIDQMRIGTNAQPSSELMLYLECDDDHQGNLIEGSHLGCVAPRLPPSENLGEKKETIPQSNIKEVNPAPSSQPEEGPSEGERMTAELTGIISQFMQNVEEFKLSVSSMSVSTAEQQMMLRSIMEAQDQLEREYISKKEEHRALEMQNYMGLSRNTGTFDPNRLMEGDIFRIGMHLEDIKEMIDKNVCEQISPPHSSSTPMPMKEMVHVKPSPLCMPTLSPPPSLHEGQSAGFSHMGYKMEARKEEKNKEEVEEASEVHGDEELQQRSELITTDSLLKNTQHRYCHSRSSQGSVEGLEIQTAEAEEERSSVSLEVIDNSNILAYLSGSSSSLRQRQWTPDSRSTPDSVLNPAGEWDLGECVSLAVEVSSSSDAHRDSDTHILSEPPLNTSSVSQRILSTETDSGFGSSYLNQSTSGPFQPNLLTESVHSQNNALSSTDSEGSCSNLQTAIHSASLTSQRRVSPHPSVQTQSCGAAAAAVERWVESTTKEPSVRLQGSECSPPAQLHHHVSEPALSTTMDTEERGSPLYSCSCNSEALLALQSEVSRLKKDLEEGLVQLPHLAKKMDYLTSKYRQDRQERKSKTRPRTHHRPACNSVWKPSSGSTQNVSDLSSSQVRIEDWISSNMGPSHSKGTDSGETAGSEIMLQFHSSPIASRRGGSSVRSAAEFQYKLREVLQSNRGSEGNGSVRTSRLNSSILKGGKASDSHTKQRLQTVTESSYSKEGWSLFSSASLQKPLLQVSYGSSSSLPASYKVREPPLQSTSHHRKRSTQSDSALLPSNVYFQRTPSPVSMPSKTGSRTGRHRGNEEEDMNRTLDQAIKMARSMKRTTDRMAKRLSADLAETRVHRRHDSMQPPGGRKHHEL
ncbi:AT-hook-containing transcription factor isoform X2 [Perca flavescens]|uniref:AT-hook-containing transcription factor isoform X2 n=1 Tax=Perca flavescens TaxID=8167 RepID=UPI00106DD997|nr:AT-hook-containing transcription factor-like isoform X2 [Perca flavescens]